MSYDWIKDVLTDLRDFARCNDMPHLAIHLDDALELAGTEIARAVSGDGPAERSLAPFPGQGDV